MRTDELVATLARGSAPVVRRRWWQLQLPSAALGLLVAVAAVWLGLGINPQLSLALEQWTFGLKLGFSLTLGAVSFVWWLRLGQPGATAGAAPTLTGGLFALVLALGAIVLLSAEGQRLNLLLGTSWLMCPWLIAMLSLPTLALGLLVMRRMAPTRLRLSGAVTGLLAGAIGMGAYVWHCPELQAPFIAVWYSLGALVPTMIGAVLGPRVLRW